MFVLLGLSLKMEMLKGASLKTPFLDIVLLCYFDY